MISCAWCLQCPLWKSTLSHHEITGLDWARGMEAAIYFKATPTDLDVISQHKSISRHRPWFTSEHLYIMLGFTSNVILSLVFAQETNPHDISSSTTLSLRGQVFWRLQCQRWLFMPLPGRHQVLPFRFRVWITTSPERGKGKQEKQEGGREWKRLLNTIQELCSLSNLV